jgi:hypothetical protein
MTAEDRLRKAIQDHTSRVEPRPDGLARIEEKLMAEHSASTPTSRNRMALAAGALAAVVLLVVGFIALTGDDDDPVDIADDTSSTTETTEGEDTTTSTTEAEDTTTTTEADEEETTTTETAPPPQTPVDPDAVLFPDPFTSQRFEDPQAVAAAFATDVVGMDDPTIGEFMQGDSRSGEVQVSPLDDGRVFSTVLVRQMEDDSWFVIGAVTDEIVLEDPENGGSVGDPVQLSGQARAFEGTVLVTVLADGHGPVGDGFVTGGGAEVLPFEGEIDIDLPDGAERGILLLYTDSAEDGRVWLFTAHRILFDG